MKCTLLLSLSVLQASSENRILHQSGVMPGVGVWSSVDKWCWAALIEIAASPSALCSPLLTELTAKSLPSCQPTTHEFSEVVKRIVAG